VEASNKRGVGKISSILSLSVNISKTVSLHTLIHTRLSRAYLALAIGFLIVS